MLSIITLDETNQRCSKDCGPAKSESCPVERVVKEGVLGKVVCQLHTRTYG